MVREGEVVQIISLSKDNRLTLVESALSRVLGKCSNIPVAVICIAGPAREGKSFLMNFILQYCEKGWNQKNNWITDIDMTRKFPFGNGLSPVTHGILMWSEPLIVRVPESGKEMAILLMDTQGLYDKNTSSIGNKILCALSSLSASLLMLNAKNQFNEAYLESFGQMFLFGLKVMSERGGSPFQELCFLYRDFELEERNGWQGGQHVINEFLKETNQQTGENHENRSRFRKCYPKSKCFLFPRPGDNVPRRDFDGKLEYINDSFKSSLKDFCAELPKLVKPRSMNGETFTGASFFNALKEISELMNKNVQMTADEIQKALDRGKIMTIFISEYDNYISDVTGQENHLLSKAKELSSNQFQEQLTSIYCEAAAKARSNLNGRLAAVRNLDVENVGDIQYEKITGRPASVMDSLTDSRAKAAEERHRLLIQLKQDKEELQNEFKIQIEKSARKHQQKMEEMTKMNEVQLEKLKKELENQRLILTMQWETERARHDAKIAKMAKDSEKITKELKGDIRQLLEWRGTAWWKFWGWKWT